MAEALLLPVVRAVLGKAADELVQGLTRMWGVDDDRRKLERRLMYVQDCLADAEAKSESNPGVKVWMKELKAAAYQADDVLDNFRYEALRRKALRDGGSTASKILSNFTSKNGLVFRLKASKDLKNVLDKIDSLMTEKDKFDLKVAAEAPAQQAPHRQTHSALDKFTEIFGRDDDKEVVVKLLLDKQDQQGVQVLPITGMGGVGKTTLAKMVYNNDRIKTHFELKMWYCVSENFEAIPIVRSVIEQATNSKCDLQDNIELLRKRLQEAIGHKRFLLILDDVWNEDQSKWEDDLKPLLCSVGGRGSMILVTSRSHKVASIMSTLLPHELVCLSEDDSWRLFSKKAFSKGVQEQPELVRIGRRISNKCKGLPLALKTMGGLMSSKQQIQEWVAIADCTSSGKEDVLPILKLSYKYLTSEMKQCFAFCAIFPEDYEMEKDMLIQLWIANDFIHEEGAMDLEQKGEFVFKELVWRSFLQHVTIVREPGAYSHLAKQLLDGCKMHDLMHDLAKDVASECATAKELIQRNISINDISHLWISKYAQLDEISQLLRGRGPIYVRTLLMPSSRGQNLTKSILLSSRALRFSCRNTSIVQRHLTHTTHLRYLDLSNSDIVSLPNSICTLYNLQSLRLDNCSKLQYLPEGITTMTKLSHIYLLGCVSMEQMPPKLSLLHKLRTLTKFIVDTKDGCQIEELKGLQQLSNRLELYNLQKVKLGSEVNLHEKKNLNDLLLYWGNPRGVFDKPTIDEVSSHEQVLESLVPHGELKILEVHMYGGLTVSQWMRNPQLFQHLRELIMTNCQGCKDLPIVWLSSSLEHLYLSHMESLTTLCKNIDVEAEADNTSLQIFPKLKRMELMFLPKLERWAENSAGEINASSLRFPHLEKLEIMACGKLSSLPEIPVLTHLEIVDCDKLSSLPEIPVLTYLELLYYKENKSTGSLVSMCMPLSCLSSLVHLRIGMLVDLVMPPDGKQNQRPLNTLRHLQLEDDNSFESIFNKSKLQLRLQNCLAFVEELQIRSCFNIVRWPVEELRCFPRLRSLCIWECFRFEWKGSSPEEEEILHLPQLESLSIVCCDSLLQVPKLPTSLEETYFRSNKSLVALPSNLGDLAKLRDLDMIDCGALKALPDGMDGLISLERLTISLCPGIEKLPQGLLERLPALKYLWISGCPDLQRRCREGGEYFDWVTSIPEKHIPAPAPVNKPVKWFFPSCGGGSQCN